MARWLPKFADYHRHDAVRILDFPHAGEHLAAVGQAGLGEGSSAASHLTQLHALKHQGPPTVLAEVQRLVTTQPAESAAAGHLAYLEKREAQMCSRILAAGWPIGDGAVESANKLVVEPRLKGSGMHWSRTQVNPMLALRNIVCHDRWDEAWPQIVQTLRQQGRAASRNHHGQRHPIQPSAAPPHASQSARSNRKQPRRPLHPNPPAAPPPTPTATAQTLPKQPWRPAPDHPWRRMPIGRAHFRRPDHDAAAGREPRPEQAVRFSPARFCDTMG